jgi:hypothetical protein
LLPDTRPPNIIITHRSHHTKHQVSIQGSKHFKMFPTEYGSNTLSHVASPFKPHLDPQRRQPDQTLYTIDFSPKSSCTNFSNSADQVSWAGNEP